MKRMRAGPAVGLLLAACACALIAGRAASGSAQREHEAKEAQQHAPTDEASIAAGAKSYAKYCVACHGASGHGDGPAAAGLKPPPRDFSSPKNFKMKNDGELFEVVSRGGPSEKLSPVMPAWGGTLNKSQIWQVIAYVRSIPARDSLARANAGK
jgi:mono/diheme cytochrome c family protein